MDTLEFSGYTSDQQFILHALQYGKEINLAKRPILKEAIDELLTMTDNPIRKVNGFIFPTVYYPLQVPTKLKGGRYRERHPKSSRLIGD